MNLLTPIAGISVIALFTPQSEAQSPIRLNEIYASHSGLDTAEFIELIGPPNASLDNHLVLIVEGDGAGAGTLERAWLLSGETMPASGFFVLGDTALAPDFDIGASNSIESGTVLFYLVLAPKPQVFLGLLGTDISTGPFTTQIPSLATIIDHVAMIDGGFLPPDRVYDFPLVLGPDGPLAPAGIYRGLDAPNPWCATSFLDFTAGGANQAQTPGSSNPPCPPPLPPAPFFGLAHQALGQSGLALNDNDHLVISNIGSTGQDGVRITLGYNEAFVTAMTLDPEYWPQGANLRSEFTANVNGVSGQPGGTLGLRREPTGFVAIPDFSALGSPTYSVEIFDDGQSVFCQSGFSGAAVTMEMGNAIGLDCDCLLNFWCCRFDENLIFDMLGGLAVLGDHIVFSAEFPAPSVGFLESVEILGQGLGAAMLEDEALRLFGGNDHRALGQATFASSGGILVIANIGSSGEDGVSIDIGEIGPGEGFEVLHSPIHLQAGEGYTVKAIGNFGGVSGTNLGNASWSNVGGQLRAFADFSSIGSTNVRIQVLDGGSVVGETVVPGGGVVARLNPGPMGPPGFISTGKLPPSPPCFGVRLDRIVSVIPSNGQGPFVGDELRLLAENPTGSILELETLALCFRSLGTVRILDERGTTSGLVSYCDPANANSVSPGGAILQSTGDYGGPAASFNIIDTAAGMPGILFTGVFDPGALPFGCGLLCVGGSVLRYGPFFPPAGQTSFSLTIDMTLTSNTRIQWWYRDPANLAACGGTVNLSNALMQ